MPTQKKRKSKPQRTEIKVQVPAPEPDPAPWASNFTLPCGCTPGYGPGVLICDHPCHWVHRFMFTESPLPETSAA